MNLAATVSNGWSFLYWQGDLTGASNPVDLVMSKTNQVQGIFGTEVSTNMSGGGTVVFSHPNPVPFGTSLRATAVSAPGYYFVAWSGAASGTVSPTTILVTEATPTVGALFSAVPAGKCTLNVVVSGMGRVTVNPQQPYYNLGDTVTLTATATNAYVGFAGWSGDASGQANPLSLLLDTNKVVQANFGAPPAVSISPSNLIVMVGSNGLLHAEAGGCPPLSYQWLKDSGPLAGATSADYTIASAQAGDAGDYSVVVSNALGLVTSAVATVTVVFPPSITVPPQSQDVAAGTSLSLSVLVGGTTPLNYQWRNSLGPIAGATNASYTLNPVQTNHTDFYSVVVTNLYGVVTSAEATVFVYVPVSISVPPASRAVSAGATASFSVVAGGYPAPWYQWTFQGTNLPGATSTSLTITNVRLAGCGDYFVWVGNGYPSDLSVGATLAMLPTITSPYIGASTIWGRSATLSVGAIGTEPVWFQWFKDGVAILDATNKSFTLPTVQFSDGGFYSVVVSSPLGSITNTPAQLIVNPADMDLGLYAGITITGAAGYHYEIQYTMDLTVTNAWVTLTNLTLQAPVELWVDTTTNATETHRRFYRILPEQ